MSANSGLIELAHAGPIQVGGLEVRPSTREIIAAAERETLQPRIMQVLVALARSGGEVVSRDDLIRSCWDGLSVGDDAVNRCIARLRELGARHDAFTVETIPRVGYRLVTRVAPAKVEAAKVDAAKAGAPVLAVLPFDNLSSDPELQFFSDGVSEEILGAVMRISGLRVLGSTSTFSFRGVRKAEAASALGATHVLDGSVRRGGARIRVAAQLSEAGSGQVIWRESYDRDIADVLALQDEIAAMTGAALSERFAPPTTRAPQLDPQAYDLYLRALALSKTPDRWAQQKAIAYLEGALAIEPRFARARATLALALCGDIIEATSYLFATRPEAFEAACARVRQEAERALAVDPDEAEARFVLLSLEPAVGNWRAHEEAIDAALARTPNAPLLRDARARACMAVGRMRDGFEHFAAAYCDDPLSPHRIAQEAGRQFSIVGDYAAARALYEKASDLAGADEYLWRMHSAFLTSIGDLDALEALHSDKQKDLYGISPARHGLFQEHLALMRKPDADAQNLIGRFEAVMRASPFSAFALFFALTSIRQDARALALIEEAMAIHPPHKVWTAWNIESVKNVGSMLFFLQTSARVRALPGFLPLCGKIGLCAYWAETGRWPDFILDAPDRDDLERTVRALSNETGL